MPDMQAAEVAQHALKTHSGNDASPLCLLTGSEDRTMRHMLYRPPAASVLQHNTGSRQQRSATDGQRKPADGQSAEGNKPAGLGERQGVADDGRQVGLFGGFEVGFQAAGSAVKSIMTISFGAGLQAACKGLYPGCSDLAGILSANLIAIAAVSCSVA